MEGNQFKSLQDNSHINTQRGILVYFILLNHNNQFIVKEDILSMISSINNKSSALLLPHTVYCCVDSLSQHPVSGSVESLLFIWILCISIRIFYSLCFVPCSLLRSVFAFNLRNLYILLRAFALYLEHPESTKNLLFISRTLYLATCFSLFQKK